MANAWELGGGPTRLVALLFWILLPTTALAANAPATHFSTFAAGGGPSHAAGVYHLLDRNDTPGQSNAVAFDLTQVGAFTQMTLRCKLRVLAGGDGGAFLFLNTAEYGKRGPAPLVKNWTEPNLRGTFAVGIDVYDPPNTKQHGVGGNYQGLPEREVSLHWDGREIVKRAAPVEFRGDFTSCEIEVQQVTGGAEISVRLAGAAVYDHFFLPGMHPYEARLAIGAGTRNDVTTEFDVQNIVFTLHESARPRHAPQHFSIFNHVLTGNSTTSYVQELTLPPHDWAFGRVILTLEINAAEPNWDPWDRNGALSIVAPDGVRYAIVPFITSFRTPCHWQVDVTPFRPWLAGKVTFEISAGTTNNKNRGYMLSAALDFYHGLPKLEPYRIVPLWVGTAKYKSAENHFKDFFPPRTISIDAATQAARLFITATGHSQIGEFTPSRRTLIFAPQKGGAPATERHFKNLLWKTDCYLNPTRPQFGTWQFSRAGWAPGDIVHPWWIDLTPYLLPGQPAELRYEPEPYDFSTLPAEQRPPETLIDQASQVVRAYLILYRSPADLIPAPVLQVIGVEDGSTAAKAGIQVNDYLESYDGKRPDSIDDLRAAIRAAKAAGKKRVLAVIYRGSGRIEKELVPGRMGVNLAEH